jgi:hypothetical protein
MKTTLERFPFFTTASAIEFDQNVKRSEIEVCGSVGGCSDARERNFVKPSSSSRVIWSP